MRHKVRPVIVQRYGELESCFHLRCTVLRYMYVALVEHGRCCQHEYSNT